MMTRIRNGRHVIALFILDEVASSPYWNRMRKLISLSVFFCSFRAFAAGPLDSVSFLTGCWGTTNEKHERVTEDWFRPSNQVMIGVAQTRTLGNDLIEYETIEIRWIRETNQVLYTPTLNGRRLNSFKLESGARSPAAAVFADPGNSNLRTIGYSLKSAGVLGVRLAGVSSGSAFDFSFEMNREDCRTRF